MKPEDPRTFQRKRAEAPQPKAGDKAAMIRTQMNRSDWFVLLLLAAIWGGAFFFIGVAVRHVTPLTYVWLRVTIAAIALWIYVKARGDSIALPRRIWGSILLLAVLNNALPFTLFGWSQTHIASGLASILNATTPIWGVVVAHVLTKDERMTARKIAGVLLGFGGVATMIGPSLLADIGSSLMAQLACVTASLSYALAGVWARRFKRLGISPLSVTTGQMTAAALVMLPMAMIFEQPWTHPLPADQRVGGDHRARGPLHRVRLCSLFQADRSGRSDKCDAGDAAGTAGCDPSRRAVPQRDAVAARFPGPRSDRTRADGDRWAAAYAPFAAASASASSLAASELVQFSSPTNRHTSLPFES